MADIRVRLYLEPVLFTQHSITPSFEHSGSDPMPYASPNPQSLPAIASLLAQARRAGAIRNSQLGSLIPDSEPCKIVGIPYK